MDPRRGQAATGGVRRSVVERKVQRGYGHAHRWLGGNLSERGGRGPTATAGSGLVFWLWLFHLFGLLSCYMCVCAYVYAASMGSILYYMVRACLKDNNKKKHNMRIVG